MIDGSASSPRYVLMLNRHPAGPSVEQTADVEVTAIFGFSSKPLYDAFLRQSSLALTPYPLVRGFLQRLLDLGTAELRLVVLDASGPKSLSFQAASAQAIVDAFDLKRDTVEASYELVLDESSGLYQVHSLAVPPTPKAVG